MNIINKDGLSDSDVSPGFNKALNKTLDPNDWEKIRLLGHRMVDDMMDLMEHIGKQPVWRQIPADIKRTYLDPVPLEPSDVDDVYAAFKKEILPFAKGNIHPRFFAWVEGTGTPMGVLAEMLGSAMNSNVAIGEHSAMYIDAQVVNWCKQLMQYPEDATGILLSGASMANITALNVARNTQLKKNVRQEGIHAVPGQMVMYCSAETHSCVQKAAESIGIGSNAVRRIAVTANYQIDLPELKLAIETDIAAGLKPFCVVGNAGTVNTGAIDPLDELAEICRKFNLWLHIDGAFGAIAKMLPEYSEQLKAIEVADSVAFDLHKWMYMPYEIACVLIKDGKAHRESFANTPSYLVNADRGLAAGPDPINNFGLELSRGFKALKVWMSLKEHGLNRYIEVITKNVLQARYVEQLVQKETELEMLTPVTMNIACYRYIQKDISLQALNAINKELLVQLQEQGIASPSSTMLNGIFAIRVCIVNQRTRQSDLDLLISQSIRIGRECVRKPAIER